MMEFTAEMIAGFLGGDIVGDKDDESTHRIFDRGGQGGLADLPHQPQIRNVPLQHGRIDRAGKPFVRTFAAGARLRSSRWTTPPPACSNCSKCTTPPSPAASGISKLASVAEKAEVGADCYIGDFTVVEAGVKIGESCQIYPQVYLGAAGYGGRRHDRSTPESRYTKAAAIGRNCILHAGAVVGADGFGFMPNAAGGFDKIPQLGNVVIEDDVEIGANTCIDRAKTDSTVIRRGVKLDNLIQIGHNVQIGENTVSSAQTGIAGTSRVGRNCFLAGQVGIADHVTVGDCVKIGSKSGLDKDVPDGEVRFGYPALPGHAVPPFGGGLQAAARTGKTGAQSGKTAGRTQKINQYSCTMKKAFLFAASAAVLCSCSTQPKYVVEGDIAGLERHRLPVPAGQPDRLGRREIG